MSKKIIKIVLLTTLIVLLSIIIIIFYNSKLNNQSDILQTNVVDIEKKIKTDYLKISNEQLALYKNITSDGTMNACRYRDDDDLCVATTAILTKKIEFCGEINDKQKRFECHNVFVSQFYPDEINKCELSENLQLKINCLIDFFQIYNELDDCLNLNDDKYRQICSDILNYEILITQDNKILCNNIIDLDIQKECVIKSSELEDSDKDGLTNNQESRFNSNPLIADTDGDGLTDGEEVYKYQTIPTLIDTDGDGFNDGEEVRGGYNPNGLGLLKQ